MNYPEDFLNKITNGDSREIIKLIPEDSLDAVMIDPPFGEKMGYEGDNNLIDAEELISAFLRTIEPKMKVNAHIAIFWTMANLDTLIDNLRSSGLMYRRTLTMYLPKGSSRPYLGWLPRTQAIVIGQKYFLKKPIELHRDLTEYLSKAIDKSGLSKSEISKKLNCNSRLIMKWTRDRDPSWCLPTPGFYKQLKEILDLDSEFDILLTRQPNNVANQREDFEYKHDTYVVDDKNKEMLHPSQKPLSVIEHLVTCMCPFGGVVLDGFSGSGTTALACKNTGRNFIAIEISPKYCEIAQIRLSK